VKDQYTYPKTAEVLRVTITPAMPATAHEYRKRCPTPLHRWRYPHSLSSHEWRASHG
jgi:hypothetical protein